MNNQKLLETVADIAYQAGQQKYYSGNSRADISEFVRWASQFEKENFKTDWNETDYILAVEEFTSKRLLNSQHQTLTEF